MKWLKYVGASLCALLMIGTVPSVYFIAIGLTASHVEDDPIYFSAKLLAYVAIIVVLGLAAVKLYRSAKSQSE
jgi:hypothetical protein